MIQIRRYLRRLHSLMVLWGIDPYKTLKTATGLPLYFRDLRTFLQQRPHGDRTFRFGKLVPCLEDRSADSGTAKGQYFHQDLLVARRVFLNNPKIHVDVGSRVDGFVAHVAAFRPIEVLDIRPLPTEILNIRFLQADMMSALPESLMAYCDSLSCLHALEHFGLGRYGDPIRYDGHEMGFDNLCKVLKTNGKLYLSVPIGPQRIEFNGQRVFSVHYLMELLKPRFRIDSFSYVDDEGCLFEDVELTAERIENNYGCGNSCGIFEATKIS
jgi:hypothetical protein